MSPEPVSGRKQAGDLLETLYGLGIASESQQYTFVGMQFFCWFHQNASVCGV